MNYINQVFGTRKVIKNYCDDADWTAAGMQKPSNISDWVLGECLNCGSIRPVLMSNLKQHMPKRCTICSNIGNHNKVETIVNNYAIYDNYAVINILWKNTTINCYIDIDMVDICKQYTWRISKKRNKYYVIAGSFYKDTSIYLHQLILGKPETGFEIDHIDGNSLNNRKSNLRFLTRGDNARNTQVRCDSAIGIKGITQDKRNKQYRIDFTFDHHRFYFKSWNTLEEAVWCRYCAERVFNMEILIHNPLFKDLDILPQETKNIIQNYVQEILSK